MGINKFNKTWSGPSNSEQYLKSRSYVPQVSALMAQGVSETRRDMLSSEVEQGLFKDGSGPNINETGSTVNSNVVSSVGVNKFAQVVSSGGGFKGSSGDTVKQSPEVYSPLWLNSNQNMPRDRATINAWCRSFYALNPFVHNAINLHSTYPISKLNIKCPNKDIEKFFNDMIEEIDLMNICVQIAQEFWLLGESFIYAELDESLGKWSRLLIQNPDYMIVKRTVVANEPIIMLRPDDNLKKIIFSNRPNDIEQRKQLNQHIIDSVKHGNNIPLDNFHVSHLARRISPYEIRGTGLPICIFRQLMLMDKLRECHDEQTEVLTDQGFKKITDLVHQTSNISINPNYVNGVLLNENGQVSSILTMKEDFKVACVNPKDNSIEYHKPNELHMSHYKGEMIHFNGKKVDCLVTPNHKMWIKESKNNKWGEYNKVPASKLLEKKKSYKFNSNVKFAQNEYINNINICGVDVPTDLYLKVLGYVISEGCVYSNYKNGRYDAFISVNQLTSSDCFDDMKNSFDEFAALLGKKSNNYIKNKGSGYSKNTPKEMWSTSIHGKDIVKFFIDEIATEGNALSHFKRIPRWALNLNIEQSNILLNALVKGDGTEKISKYGTGSKNYTYSTVSKQLSDDVYELVYKIGFVPNICINNKIVENNRKITEYIVMWSDTNYGNEPCVNTCDKINNNGGGARANKINYEGVVWCFEVPTGLFVTRRNGKITVQGNSKFAQADGMINPLTLVKIGGEGNDALHPTFADLEAWRDVFECYDEETEVLTDKGFKKFNEAMNFDSNSNNIKINATPKSGIKVACFNPNNNQLEYHNPLGASLYNYDGDMYHFANEKIDIKVTPNHDMWISEKEYKYYGNRDTREVNWGEWKKIKAKDIKLTDYKKFRSKIEWVGKDDIKSVNVCDKEIPIELYLEFLGYLLSEGCLYTNNESQYTTGICQSTKKYSDIFNDCISKFSKYLEKSYSTHIKISNNLNWSDMWNGVFSGKQIYEHFKNEIGDDLGQVKAPFKRIPKWILNLSPRLLNILLKAMVLGDGSVYSRKQIDKNGFAYYTTSKELSDNIYEIVYKCGFVPTFFVRDDESYIDRGDLIRLPLYTIMWSNSGKGEFPLVYKTSRNSETKEKHNLLNIEKYKGKVWCFQVPTGLFITRRNGKITIQGNSAQYDKDFKIFSHAGITVERVGYGQGIYDISGDITQIIKEIYVGLQVPPVLMDGGADTSYANGGVALDVLRQRYMQFRNMMSQWLKRKIFAPISKIQGFYEYSGGEKQLIVPEVDWNHMSLFDAGDYINSLVTLTTGEGEQKRASLHTLYRSMGLEFEDEVRKMRKEAIVNETFKKEKIALSTMDLNALRVLDDEDEIPEPKVNPGQQLNEAPLPGEAPPGGMPDLGSMPGSMPGGPMPSAPPTEPSGGSPPPVPPTT